MDGHDIPGKETAFYSTEFGQVIQMRITSILKSKFKVDPPKLYRIKDQVLRCMKFEQKYLDKIIAYYEMPNKIEVLDESKFVTDVTDVTLSGRINTDLQDNSDSKNPESNDISIVNEPKIVHNNGLESEYNSEKQGSTFTETVTSVTSVTEKERLE